MLRMTPPSARTAEPLIEVACALATNATTAATSSGVSKRFKSEEGRTAEKNCFSISAFVMPCCLAMLSTKSPTPSEAVGPARMEFTVTPVPATDSAKPRASGTCWRNFSTPWAVPRSAGTPRRSAFSTLVRIFLTAASTRASVRPLTMTLAPSAASAAAMAKPIPAVDPDTTAVLPLIFRSISRFLVGSYEFLPDANSSGYAFDFGDLARGEPQFTSAHDAFGLLGVARANNGAGDSGMAQGPGDGDFTGGTPMACAHLAQALDEFDIFRQAWLAKFRTAAAKIIGWQRGGALASHGPGEQAGGHRGIHNHADPLLFTVGQSFRFDLPPDQRVRRLKGCYRGNLFGALNLLRIEVRNTDPTNFPFFLERGERLPCFFETGTVVVRRPMDLVKVDRVHLQAAQTVLAFAADRSGAEFLSGVPFFVPAKDALGEHIGARAAPFLQRAGYDFFGMAHAVDGGGIDPIDAKFERTLNRRDGIRILLRAPGKFPA